MVFDEFLNKIDEADKRAQVGQILEFIHEAFPELEREVESAVLFK